MIRRIVIAGAGAGGQVIFQRLCQIVKEDVEVYMIGPEDFRKPGLFYFNRLVRGVAEKPIPVTYKSTGEGTFEDYQRKSRGSVESSVTVSSFSNIGRTVVGYQQTPFTESTTNPSHLWVKRKICDIDFKNKKVLLDAEGEEGQTTIDYDYLISTIPLPVLAKIASPLICINETDFKYSPVYQCQVGTTSQDVDEIDVTYDLTDSVFYRHSSYIYRGNVQYIVSESIVDFDGRTSVLYPGKIIPDEEITRQVAKFEEENPSCILCGRYARWDYHYTVDRSVEDAEKFISEKGLI